VTNRGQEVRTGRLCDEHGADDGAERKHDENDVRSSTLTVEALAVDTSARKSKREKRLFRLNVPTAICTSAPERRRRAERSSFSGPKSRGLVPGWWPSQSMPIPMRLTEGPPGDFRLAGGRVAGRSGSSRAIRGSPRTRAR
jgi:hypothetical protein